MFEFECIKEAFFILLVVLGLLIVAFCILGVIADIVEKDIGVVVIVIFGLLIGGFFVYTGVSYYEPLPETIEKDGYTYILYEEPPEEFIEYNGHTYRLGDSV